MRKTKLIVVEGKAEEVFVKHLVSLYVVRGASTHPTVKNARGKGGTHVLDIALRHMRSAQFDQVALVLDTDVQWGPKEQRTALDHGMSVIENLPCFEAFLLEIMGIVEQGASKDQKKRFLKELGGEAHNPQLIQKNFSKELIEREKLRVVNLQELIRILS